eukprot:GFUD01039212.1.p1 GENE.GFUD01039212.1~~GFUD01039212.1.p1  ORF type:complete len:667 (+),score=167.98 GFUD01039212.1:101-2101(+)
MSTPPEDVRWGTMIPLIGGSALGCSRATGNMPLFHLSYSPFAANESHLARHWPSIPTYRLDKTTFPAKQILAEGEIDFINSVCPCAGLSMLNTASKGPSGRGADAIQNEWMIKSAQFVLENVQPKVLWGENAPGLFLALGAAMVPRLRSLGMNYGYSFSMVKTNTQLHGLPQQRMRTFYFFWRSPTVPLLNYIKKEAPPLIEYLRAIPKEATFQDKFVAEGKVSERFKPYLYVLLREGLNHKEFGKKMAEKHGVITISKYLDKYNLIDDCISWLKTYFPTDRWSVNPKGGKSRTHVQYLEHQKEKLSRGLGYWDDSPKFMGDHFTAVITKNVVFAVHPEEDRFLNIREIMHLMGLPHDFQIDDPKNWNHVCQNVPLNTAADWAGEVLKFCRGEAEMTNFSFLKQDNCSQRIVEKEFVAIKQEIKVEEDLDNYSEYETPEMTVADLHSLVKEGRGDKRNVEQADIKVENELKKPKVEIEQENKQIPLNIKIKEEQENKHISLNIKIKEEPCGQENQFVQPMYSTKLQPLKLQPKARQPLQSLGPQVQDMKNAISLKPKIEHKSPKKLAANPTQLKPVIKSEYSSDTIFKCGLCKVVAFQSKAELKSHFSSCKLEPQVKEEPLEETQTLYSCGLCQFKVPLKKSMTEHWVSGCSKLFNKTSSSKSIRM